MDNKEFNIGNIYAKENSMLESIKKNKKGILLMTISSLLACVGQLLFNLAASDGIWYVLLGLVFYGMGAVCMLMAYRFGKLSVLQPILSLNYIFSLFLGALVLKETISITKIIGVSIVICGVMLITAGDEE